MIAVLIIGNLFTGLLIHGGLSLWCEITFSVIVAACVLTACILWEEAADKIKRLERQIDKMKGGGQCERKGIHRARSGDPSDDA